MSFDPITPSDRIRELATINADVASLVSSAGRAINALTNRPLTRPDEVDDEDTEMTTDSSSPSTLESRKQTFQQNSTDYYTNLQSIIARLRRQTYALEEAGIISSDADEGFAVKHAPPLAGPPRGGGGRPAAPQAEKITNNGLGEYDIGFLNSKANKVGAEKEKELVADAKQLLEDVLAQNGEG